MYCIPHGEVVVNVGRRNGELIGMCSKCVPSAKPPLFLVEEILKEIEDIKTLIVESIEANIHHNFELLNELSNYLKKFKEDQERLIDCVLSTILQQQTIIQKKGSIMQSQINTFVTFDKTQLLDFLEKNNDQINFTEQKILIKTQLEQLNAKQINKNFSTFYQIFPKIHKNEFLLNQTNFATRQSQLLCPEHKQDVIGVDLNEFYIKNRLYCNQCYSENPRATKTLQYTLDLWNNHQLKTINLCEQFQEKQNTFCNSICEVLSQKQEILQNKVGQLQSKLDILKYYKINLIQKYVQKKKLNQLDLCSFKHIQELIFILTRANQNHQQIQDQFISFDRLLQIKGISIFANLKEFLKTLKTAECLLIEKDRNQVQFKPFQYIIKGEINYDDTCYSLSINYKQDTLITSCGKIIQVYSFSKGNLKLIEELKGHTNKILCLQFMKTQNKFISAGNAEDGTIRIWSQSQNQRWFQEHTLSKHKKGIFCITINQDDNLLISGSGDNSIMIWNLQNNLWINQQKLLVHKGRVNSISLNQDESKLISCGEDKQILIMKKIVIANKWEVLQIIKHEVFGFRLLFLQNDMFSFLPNLSPILYIFEYDQSKDIFIKTREVAIHENGVKKDTCFFQQQFIEAKQILLSKNGIYVDFIQRLENGEFSMISSIQFQTQGIYGIMTADGEFLITWDKQNKKIQIRQYHETQELQETQVVQ